MVVKLTVAYLGGAYAGWQRQDNARSVQEVVEHALADLVGEPIRIHGAGRTDAGVHADGQVAHLHLRRPFATDGLVHGTNHRLPDDVRLLAAERMPEAFHARKSAIGKCYLYRLDRRPVVPPHDALTATRLTGRLDLEAMRAGLRRLVGRHDFTAFAAAGGSHGQPFRRVFGATLDTTAHQVVLRFYGDGFLRGMVRALVGTLIDVGRGRRTDDDVTRLLGGRPRAEAGPSAPAKGLTLERVYYPTRAP